MANDLSSRQWRLDTPVAYVPGTPAMQQPGLLWPSEIKVAHFEWTGYAAAATCVLKDRNGKIKWSPTAATDLEEVRTVKVGWIEGLILDTLSSGVVTVYTE